MQNERDQIVALIKQKYTNKQIREITGVSYRRISAVRESLPPDEIYGSEKDVSNMYMRAGFWDEWELAVYRLFGGKKQVHLNP